LHRFLIKEEFLITQDSVTVQVQLTQAIANGLWLALPIAPSGADEHDAAD